MKGFKPTGYGPSAGFRYPANMGFTGSTGRVTNVQPYVRRKHFANGGFVREDNPRMKEETIGDQGSSMVRRKRAYAKWEDDAGAHSSLLPGYKSGGSTNWIKGAIKKPGALHQALGVPKGEKIPAKKLAKAANSSNPTMRRRAALAKTLKKMHKADGGLASMSEDYLRRNAQLTPEQRSTNRKAYSDMLHKNVKYLADKRDSADAIYKSYPFTDASSAKFFKERADWTRRAVEEEKEPRLDESWRHKAHPASKTKPVSGAKGRFYADGGGVPRRTSNPSVWEGIKDIPALLAELPGQVIVGGRRMMSRTQKDVADAKRRRIDAAVEGDDLASNYKRGGKAKRMGYAMGGMPPRMMMGRAPPPRMMQQSASPMMRDQMMRRAAPMMMRSKGGSSKMKRMGYASGGGVTAGEAKKIAERTVGDHVKYKAPLGHKGLGKMIAQRR